MLKLGRLTRTGRNMNPHKNRRRSIVGKLDVHRTPDSVCSRLIALHFDQSSAVFLVWSDPQDVQTHEQEKVCPDSPPSRNGLDCFAVVLLFGVGSQVWVS